MAPRFVATSRLSNIIQMITLSRQTGILRATRGQGPQREMGQIRFLHGEPVSALLGSLTGGTALSALSIWGESMYSFDETEADIDPNQMIPPSQPGPFSPTPSPSASMGSSWPSYGYPSSSSLNPMSPAGGDFGMSAPGDPAFVSPLDAPAQASSYAGSGAPAYTDFPPMPTPMTPASTPSYAVRPEQLASTPRRTSLSRDVDQLPLDRRERMVLLLVDGQRTVSDLVRLTRRSEDDLYSVLNHLRILGLVQL